MRAMSFVVILGLLLVSCQPAPVTPDPARTGDYLGESLPGETPAIFAEGLVSTNLDVRDTTWSPDGDELYYTLWARNRGTIVTVQRTDGVWASPEIANFSGVHSDLEAFVTPDGDELYFASKRPLDSQGGEKDWDLWVTRRNASGWGEPQNLGPTVNSPDGKYFFWTSGRVPSDLPQVTDYDELVHQLSGSANGSMNVYWVSADLIDTLRPRDSE